MVLAYSTLGICGYNTYIYKYVLILEFLQYFPQGTDSFAE